MGGVTHAGGMETRARKTSQTRFERRQRTPSGAKSRWQSGLTTEVMKKMPAGREGVAYTALGPTT